MNVPMADTEYIKRMVGDTLAKGCAATMTANPMDPVEYLGQWLLQYVHRRASSLFDSFMWASVHSLLGLMPSRQAKVSDVQKQLQQEQDAAAEAAEAQQVRSTVDCDSGGRSSVIGKQRVTFLSNDLQALATATGKKLQEQQSKQQEALDSVSAIKSDLWALWQQVVSITKFHVTGVVKG